MKLLAPIRQRTTKDTEDALRPLIPCAKDALLRLFAEFDFDESEMLSFRESLGKKHEPEDIEDIL